MASADDLIAALARSSLETQTVIQDALRQTQADIRTLISATGTAAAAGPAAVSALQIVRKSSEATVQLSLSDTQNTVLEDSGPQGLTNIYALPETTQVEVVDKSGTLLDFHRNRGFKVRDAQRTLPDGAWVNDTPDDVGRCRLPSPPLRSLTHSDLNRREQSAVTALSRRQWDKRWSFSYNICWVEWAVKLCNIIRHSQVTPRAWHVDLVYYAHKGGSDISLATHRPLALIEVFRKVFTSVIIGRMRRDWNRHPGSSGSPPPPPAGNLRCATKS